MEQCQRRDVPRCAVGVFGKDGHLLRRPLPVNHGLSGIEFNTRTGSHVSRILRRIVGDPLDHIAIHEAVLLEQLSARMRNGSTRLFDHQAGLRHGQIDATAGLFTGDAVIVAVGIKTKQGKIKAVLAASRTVTAAAVAAGLHEDGHHVQFEAHWTGSSGFCNCHWNLPGLTFKGDRQLCLPVS